MFDRILLIMLVLFVGCETQGNTKPTGPQSVRWEAISPPRPDLECWRLYNKESYDYSGTYAIQCWPVGGPMYAVDRDVVGAAGGAR